MLAIHRWAGLVLGLAMGFFSLTGLVLLFHHEIDALLGQAPAAASLEVARGAPLADALAAARRARPDRRPLFLSQDAEEHPGLVLVGMVPPGGRTPADAEFVVVELSRARVLDEVPVGETFTQTVLELHAQLLAGPAGSFVVGLLGLALLLTLGTGVIAYGPTMKRLAFGVVRRGKHRRLALVDLHRLVGVVSFGWLLVVTATGVLLSAGGPLLKLFATTELAALAAPYAGEAPVDDVSNVDEIVRRAEAAVPGRRWSILVLPGAELSSPRHFSALLEGTEGLEAHLLTFALLDATDPDVVQVRQLPGYLQAVLLSQPLHFGDYGGWPLRLLWALFALMSLALAVTGPLAFLVGRRRRARRLPSAEAVAPS
ncbi:MAG TPA: PepSY-associated TM helix domain-containing protein [Sandaracinaceae bacterium LLY-WYZ-13_1]|nr:PepSY-associated TM helix domain-containing protein [Sandaracinaceae bacterium LLY-WYZ-13_1]